MPAESSYPLTQAILGLIRLCESRREVDTVLAALPQIVPLMAEYVRLPQDSPKDSSDNAV